MKKEIIFLAGLILSFAFVGCENQFTDQDEAAMDELTIAEVEIGALKAVESVDEEVNAARFAASLRGIYDPHFVVPRYHFGDNFPACAVVTVDRDSFPKMITIEYGDECETRGGIKKSGTIIISISDSLHLPGSTYTVEYNDLIVGNKKINLNGTYIYEGLNDEGNAIVSWEANSTMIIRDSIKVVRNFRHSKEWLSGFATPRIDDDIFLLSGGGEVLINDNYEFSRIISEPLLFDRSCRFALSGIIEITRNSEMMTIDFGAGDCDNIAVVTKDGESEEIELTSEKFRKDFQRRQRNMKQNKGWW